ncbi:MAG: glycoside hydrolase family 19 protein [Betaproteobacteria bacterium]|nr:glycoside hydrolase family 19 protein [Betaproteobacteria bacterium]
MITLASLLAVMPRAGSRAAAFLAPLSRAMARYEIADSEARIAAFLAQGAHESAELTQLEENLNYSASGLVRTWPRRFSLELALACERQPERIANVVYANRLGNGDEASGDGWRFRGRGIFQLTGRENYADASLAICGDASVLVESPQLVAEPEYACETAGWYWQARGLNELADAGEFTAITRRINGGTLGIEERTAYWKRAIGALA